MNQINKINKVISKNNRHMNNLEHNLNIKLQKQKQKEIN